VARITVALACPKTIQQWPLTSVKIKTGKSDCGATTKVEIDHRSRLPAFPPVKSSPPTNQHSVSIGRMFFLSPPSGVRHRQPGLTVINYCAVSAALTEAYTLLSAVLVIDFTYFLPPVLWHFWFGDRKDIRPVKTRCWFVGGDDLTGALHVL